MKKFKMNTMAAVAAATMLSFAVAAPAYASNKDKCANSFLGLAKQSCVEQVNLEDMRVKSGVVSGDTLTLRVEDQAKTQGRNKIYGKNVEIDVSGLNQSDEVVTNANDIKTNKDRIEQVDQEDHRAVGGTYNSGKLTINTEDMDGGSKRTFEITGLDAESKANATAISNVNNSVINNTNTNNTQNVVLQNHDNRITVNEGDISNNTKRSVNNETVNNEQSVVLSDHNNRIISNTTSISAVQQSVIQNSNGISLANQRIDGVMNDMRYMDRNLSAGIASSIAIGQHQFDPSFKGGQVSLSGGFYNGENAVSFAVGVPVGERVFFSASIATDSGSYGESGGVGLTFQLPK